MNNFWCFNNKIGAHYSHHVKIKAFDFIRPILCLDHSPNLLAFMISCTCIRSTLMSYCQFFFSRCYWRLLSNVWLLRATCYVLRAMDRLLLYIDIGAILNENFCTFAKTCSLNITHNTVRYYLRLASNPSE